MEIASDALAFGRESEHFARGLVSSIGDETLGNITNRRHGERSVGGGDGGQADLDGNFVSVGVSRRESESLTHRSSAGRVGVAIATTNVVALGSLGHESLHGLADEVGRGESGDE